MRYAATRRSNETLEEASARLQVPATPTLSPTRPLRHVRYSHSVCCWYAHGGRGAVLAQRVKCAALAYRMVLMQCAVLNHCMVLVFVLRSGVVLPAGARSSHCQSQLLCQ
eukprot:792655-Rhodomonas_salina.1